MPACSVCSGKAVAAWLWRYTANSCGQGHINHLLPPCPHHALPLVPGMLQEGPSPFQKRVVSSTVCLEDTEV